MNFKNSPLRIFIVLGLVFLSVGVVRFIFKNNKPTNTLQAPRELREEEKAKIPSFLMKFPESAPHHMAVIVATGDSRELQSKLIEKAKKQFSHLPLLRTRIQAQFLEPVTMDELNQLVKSNPEDAHPYLWKARSLISRRSYEEALKEVEKAVKKPYLDQFNEYYRPLVSFYEHMGLNSLESKTRAHTQLTHLRVSQFGQLFQAFTPFVDPETGKELTKDIDPSRLETFLLFAKLLMKGTSLIDRVTGNTYQQHYWEYLHKQSASPDPDIEKKLAQLKEEDRCYNTLQKIVTPKIKDRVSSAGGEKYMDDLNSVGEVGTYLKLEGVLEALSKEGCRASLGG